MPIYLQIRRRASPVSKIIDYWKDFHLSQHLVCVTEFEFGYDSWAQLKLDFYQIALT